MGEGRWCCKRARGPGYALHWKPCLVLQKLFSMLLVSTTVLAFTFSIGTGREKPDFLATVDVDPNSPTYSKVIHRLSLPYTGDELHHGGIHCGSSMVITLQLDVSSSCPDCCKITYSIWSCLCDRHTEESEGSVVAQSGGAGRHRRENRLSISPHISLPCQWRRNDFVSRRQRWTLQRQWISPPRFQFNIKGRWEKPGPKAEFSYDFWYQPRHKTMICSSFGAPYAFTQGFNLKHLRFLHEPSKDTGTRVYLNKQRGTVLQDPRWIMGPRGGYPSGTIRSGELDPPNARTYNGTFDLSLDDRIASKGNPIVAVAEDGTTWQADVPTSQAICDELLFSTWDRQFYPDVIEKGFPHAADRCRYRERRS
ncbi:hypothetical protein F3Y22_tig00011718pilonHSYRG00105 [Hibiscus syriacus]|uniref:Uncharacterized protein n=1 Tax=Hibiscus syriacus TaxID=106335 RepID=A0A6A3C5X8_HIBSY|nr:hypothetical protein F3Y22_tig00011718pilonHSYRG00105 [Hibiscus syriacus]